MKDFFSGLKIAITGGGGTIGKALAARLVLMKPGELRLIDNNEYGTIHLHNELGGSGINCFLGDIRDLGRMEKLLEGIDIIIHAAALKHVILSEYSPSEAVQTNIVGVENLIRAAIACKVRYLLFTSSDKAVNPTSVMGTSKLMGEKLLTATAAVTRSQHTVFSSTRFGNVLGSRGSVVPLFMEQIRNGGPVTVTDNRMTRFVMTSEEAADLVLQSLMLSKGGEVFVTKMPVIRIPDLAKVMIEILAPRYGYKPSEIETRIIGAIPGEKFHEELMSEEEVPRSLELKRLFVVTPALKSIYRSIRYEYPDTVTSSLSKAYVSSREKHMTRDELKDYLLRNSILDND